MVLALPARSRTPLSGLYALTPDDVATHQVADRVRAALAGGATAIQYRNKNAATEMRLEQAQVLRQVCAAVGAIFIVNDDAELAAMVHADGVHLGREDGTVDAARRRLGPEAIIGVSCYDSLTLAEAAVGAGADYIAFGSFFPSAVKPDAVRANVALLSAAKQRWKLPVVAIGGITAVNAPSLIAAGADVIAVISSVFDAPDVKVAARTLAELFAVDNKR
jgi:thiamine-phosphate pyrophosphorylase